LFPCFVCLNLNFFIPAIHSILRGIAELSFDCHIKALLLLNGTYPVYSACFSTRLCPPIEPNPMGFGSNGSLHDLDNVDIHGGLENLQATINCYDHVQEAGLARLVGIHVSFPARL
jgi:hypothetical protein